MAEQANPTEEVKEAQEPDAKDGTNLEAPLALSAAALEAQEEADKVRENLSSAGDAASSFDTEDGSRPPSAGSKAGMGKRRGRSLSTASRRPAKSAPSDDGLEESDKPSMAERRASITAKRRSSMLRSSIMMSNSLLASLQSPEEEPPPKPAMIGLLLDLVDRLARDLGKEGVLQNCKNDPKQHAYLKDAFEREELVSKFMDGIINYNKSSENLAPKEVPWPKTSAESMRSQISTIRASKREAGCLRAEVHNWLMKYKMFNSYVKEQYETTVERRNRMEEFWTQYHTRCKRNELPPIAVEAPVIRDRATSPLNSRPASPSNNLITTMRSAASWRSSMDRTRSTFDMDETNGFSTNKSPTRLLTSPTTAEEQWSMIDSIEARLEDSISPRKRSKGLNKSMSSPSLQSTKYGMRWSADGRGMAWQKLDPAPGTRAAIKENLLSQKLTLRDPRGSTLNSTPATASKKEKKKEGKSRTRLPELDMSSSMTSMGSMAGIQRMSQMTETSTDKYMEACQRCWIVPMPLPFVTGHSFRLAATGRDMRDADLRAITVMIRDCFSIAEVDLSGNSNLTEKALVPFIHRLFGDPASESLQRFCLSDCKNMGLGTVNMTIRLVSDREGACNLRALELSRIRITPKCHLDLAKAIHNHQCLEEVTLQDTNLGATVLAKQCLEEIVACKTLHYLDLSWNCFDPDEFLHLGLCLVDAKRIRTLNISNCSSAVTGLSNPITYFLEQMARDTKLTNLDVSINRMDFRSALIIEDSLCNHKQIRELNLSDNPFGVQGMRSALRLLSRPTCGLQHFQCHDCFQGKVFADDPKVPAQVFNMSNPGGRYSLNLEMPYHRSLLRMLYQTSERFNVPHDQAFFSINYSKGAYSHPTKDSNGIWQVADTGKLNVIYNIERAIEFKVRGIADDDFTGFLEKHKELMKWTPSFTKAVPLFACFKLMEGQAVDQHGFVEALSKDFRFPPSYMEQLYKSCSAMRNASLMGCLPCIAGGQAARTLCMCLIPSMGEAIKMYETMEFYMVHFNAENPTGHYKLNLEIASQYAVGEQLLLLDRWEVVIGKRNAQSDTSQHGNMSHFRNETYQGRPLRLEVDAVCEWTMPESDIFEFDYISAKRPPQNARVLGEEVYTQMLMNLADSECTPLAKVQAIRQVSHHFYVNSLQMREMLGSFKDESMRAEAFVALYLRVVDMYNAKVFRVRFADRAELKRLQDRLGYATFFPYIQPENAVFELDFKYHDQRLCANLILQLATKEGAQNIREPFFINADGIVDPLPLGVPRSWEKFESVPKGGVFKAQYCCGPEFRNFALRKKLAEYWGNFNLGEAREEDVMWWTGLTEPPEDVLDFLEFLIGRYEDAMQAFYEIDGEDGNGVITLREFEEGLRDLECKKFKGKDEQQRINALFRYLDPGGEGSVSEDEWGILNQLWKEFELSIKEFVYYLQRQFGDDLQDAWAFLDDDDSGELTLDEWIQAVESIGFFGPSKVVFGLLDNSDDGSISVDEFEVLNKYKKPPKDAK